MSRSVGVALLLTFVAGAPVAGQTSDSLAVAEAVERYVTGWREGDLAQLADVLDPSWRVFWTTDGDGGMVVENMTFDELVARGSRPNPDYGTETRIERLSVLDGAVAYADVSISRRSGSYLDHLVFYRKPDGWKMVIKTFVVRSD